MPGSSPRKQHRRGHQGQRLTGSAWWGSETSRVRLGADKRKHLLSILPDDAADDLIAEFEHAATEFHRLVRGSPPMPSSLRAITGLRKAVCDLQQALRALDPRARMHILDALTEQGGPEAFEIFSRRLPAGSERARLSVLEHLMVACTAAARVLQKEAKAGRPVDHHRNWLATQIAESLNRHGVPPTGAREGLFARVLEDLLEEVGLHVPKDMPSLLKHAIRQVR